MITIGLTGGIAAGKSTVARLLRERHGLPVLDADQVARAVVAPGQPALAEIVTHFGAGVLQADGSLNRGALGALVMADPTGRRALDAITHPRIRDAILAQLAAWADAGTPVAVVEAALMVETGSYRAYDKLLVVSCSPETQLRRLMSRQGFTEEEARRWIGSQLPLAEKERVADVVVFNDGDEAALALAVSSALERLVGPAGTVEVGPESGV